MIPQKPSPSPAAKRVVRADLAVLGLVDGHPETVRAPGPALVMTIESSIARASHRGEDHTLDRSSFLVVPPAARVTLRAATPAVRVAVLALHEPVFGEVARSYAALGLDRRKLERWLERASLLPRTVWVHEIVHRYVFERYALGQSHNLTTRFLEIEILKEIYFLFRDRDAGPDRATIVSRYSRPVDRAIGYLESHLFETCRVASLAARAGASESTLLRAFRREVGCTPAAYWRRRKLDEALALLRSGGRSVAEVADHVGYENATAFAHAFRLRFGRPPSAFRPRRAARPAP